MLLLLLAGAGVPATVGGGVPGYIGLAPAPRLRYGYPEQPEPPLRVREVVYRAEPSRLPLTTKPASLHIETRIAGRSALDAPTKPASLYVSGILHAHSSPLQTATQPADLLTLTRMDLVEERQGLIVAEMRRDRFARQNAEEEMMLLGFSSEIRQVTLTAPGVTVVEREPIARILSEAPEANIHCPTCRSRLPVSRRYTETVVFCRGCKHEVQIQDLTASVL